jgi:hypothetical protein
VDQLVARRLVAASVVIGALAQALFFHTAIGVNFVLLLAAVLAAAFLLRRPDARNDRADLWIAPAALAFASFPAIRADPALVAFDVLAATVLACAAVAAIGGAALTRRSFVGLLVVAGEGLLFLGGGATGPFATRTSPRRRGPPVHRSAGSRPSCAASSSPCRSSSSSPSSSPRPTRSSRRS